MRLSAAFLTLLLRIIARIQTMLGRFHSTGFSLQIRLTHWTRRAHWTAVKLTRSSQKCSEQKKQRRNSAQNAKYIMYVIRDAHTSRFNKNAINKRRKKLSNSTKAKRPSCTRNENESTKRCTHSPLSSLLNSRNFRFYLIFPARVCNVRKSDFLSGIPFISSFAFLLINLHFLDAIWAFPSNTFCAWVHWHNLPAQDTIRFPATSFQRSPITSRATFSPPHWCLIIALNIRYILIDVFFYLHNVHRYSNDSSTNDPVAFRIFHSSECHRDDSRVFTSSESFEFIWQFIF